MSSNSKVVAAVVVTKDRLTQLQECIAAVRNQTRRPDMLYVVDNGSTDGTAEWLGRQNDITVIRQVNSGVAGGTRTGLSLSQAQGYQWTWINDDDAVPFPTALETLLEAAQRTPQLRVLNSLAIDKDDHSRIAFHFVRYLGAGKASRRDYFTVSNLMAEVDADIVNGEAQFYQSSLIHREIVERVGLPDARLFIRGDEAEYLDRIIDSGYQTHTVLASRVYHPQQYTKSYHFLGRKLEYEPLPSWKRYYVVRNQIYLHRVYGKMGPKHQFPLRFLRVVVANALCSIESQKGVRKVAGVATVVQGGLAGLCMRRMKPDDAVVAADSGRV